MSDLSANPRSLPSFGNGEDAQVHAVNSPQRTGIRRVDCLEPCESDEMMDDES